MKRMVISDKKGKVICMGPLAEIRNKPLGFIGFEIEPSDGQVVHEIEMPNEYNYFNKLRVKVKDKTPYLVKKGK